MRQTGCGILEGHRPCQSKGFLGANVGRHSHAANRRSAGDVVDRDDRLEPDGWTLNVDELESAKRNASSITSSMKGLFSVGPNLQTAADWWLTHIKTAEDQQPRQGSGLVAV